MTVETIQVTSSPQSVPEAKPREEKQEAQAPLAGSPEARERQQRAEDLVRRHSLWALGSGVIPIPILDSAVATAVQFKMLKSLSDLYGVKFTEGLAKKVVSSLVMGVGSALVGTTAASLIKAIPGVGTALGAVTSALSAAAFTTAVGRVFILHFETGGTLLDFDARKVREHFRREYERARSAQS